MIDNITIIITSIIFSLTGIAGIIRLFEEKGE